MRGHRVPHLGFNKHWHTHRYGSHHKGGSSAKKSLLDDDDMYDDKMEEFLNIIAQNDKQNPMFGVGNS